MTQTLPLSIWAYSPWGVAGCCRGIGQPAGLGSNLWTTANLAVAQPIFLHSQYPVANMFISNAATINGNVDVGIYNDSFSLVASAGGVAHANASALQFFAVTANLAAGQYYLAVSSSSTTATIFAAVGGSPTRNRYYGMLQMASAYPLPATFVPVTATQNKIPAVGITWQTSPTF